jgi:translocation and assembly module TamB
VFREGGDLIAGAVTPVALGLRSSTCGPTCKAARCTPSSCSTAPGSARPRCIDATVQMIQAGLNNDSPLRLTANADMGSIAWMAPFAGQPGPRTGRRLKLAVTGSGTVGAPTLNGSVNGDRLAVRWPEQGVRLRNGQLRATLAGDRLVLQRLAFEGGSGPRHRRRQRALRRGRGGHAAQAGGRQARSAVAPGPHRHLSAARPPGARRQPLPSTAASRPTAR